jgi:hypothetical protein
MKFVLLKLFSSPHCKAQLLIALYQKRTFYFLMVKFLPFSVFYKLFSAFRTSKGGRTAYYIKISIDSQMKQRLYVGIESDQKVMFHILA